MTTYYVDGDNGSDANPGTALLPFKTLNALAVMVSGDVAILADDTTIISHLTTAAATITFTNKSNMIICRSGTGTNKPKVRGYIPIDGSWTHLGGGVYTIAIPASLTVSGLVYRWERQTAGGLHYGHCRRYASAAAVVSAASGDKGKFYYESVTTGLITAYFGGADPNDQDVGYVCSESTLGAMVFVGGSGNLISGIDFGCYPVYGGQYGWGVRLQGSTNNVIEDCEFYDHGPHAFGTLGGSGNSSGNIFRRCISTCGTYNAVPAIFHGLASEGALSNSLTDSTIITGRWLGIDQAVLDGRGDSVAAMDPNTQYGVYGHADSGTPIAMIRVSGTAFSNWEPGGLPFAINDCPAVAVGNRKTRSAFPMLIDDCTVTWMSNFGLGGNHNFIYVSRTAFVFTGTAGSGFAEGGFINIVVADSTDKFVTLDCCTVTGSLDGSGAGVETRFFSGQASTGGTKRLCLINTSIKNTGSQTDNLRGIFDCCIESVKYFEADGCIFEHAVDGSGTSVYIRDTATALAGNPIRDCLYRNINEANSRYAQNATYGASGWFTNVDDVGTAAKNVLGASPFSTGFALTPVARLLKRASFSVLPSGSGINGLPYSRQFGAEQYGGIGSRSRGRQRTR